MQNPFTVTFSKIPDYTYIPTAQTAEIIDNYSFDHPSESVYKITGVRGSGKTVLLAKIEEEFTSNPWMNEKWILYRLSPSRDMLQQFSSMLYKEEFVKKNHPHDISLSANLMGIGGGVGIKSPDTDSFFDVGYAIEEMLQSAGDHGKKILIGIDEVSKTPEMVVFASEFGKWLRAGYPVYLICTGLYENIEQLSNIKNLTFFRRATTVKTEALNFIRMTEMYKNKLNIPIDSAKRLAHATKGYAYAFQELGVLLFKKRADESEEDILGKLKAELFSYAYEKIWEEMTSEDRALAFLLQEDREYSREELLSKMEKPGNYSVYRDRLIRRGIVVAGHGNISLNLPYFNEYMRDYCDL